MTESVLKTDVYADFQGLSALRTRAKDNSDETLREVAGQFEALFIQMMLKTMRDASLGEGLLDSEHTKTYQAMFDKQIAIDMSKGSGIGLADMMVRQMSQAGGRSGAAEEYGDAGFATQDDRFLASRVRPVKTMQQPRVSIADWNPGSPEKFVEDLWPHANRTALKLGVQPEAIIAQAALETGWGKHMIKSVDGRNSFNLFGIKADAQWQGQRVTTETLEFRNGVMRKERDVFRAYQSLADSFADYADFLSSNPRYQQALQAAHDAPAFTRALSEAGYATDPDYSKKINQIMNSDRLSGAVSQIKSLGLEPLS